MLTKLLEYVGIIDVPSQEQEAWINQEIRKGATLVNYELQFGWFTYRERTLFQPHVRVPSLFLAGKYNLHFWKGSTLSMERYQQYQKWLKTLVEEKDYDCFPPTDGKIMTRSVH
jgi:hypothetical protein